MHLIADVGGTNTRVALKSSGAPTTRIRTFKNRDFANLGPLLKAYLAEQKPESAITSGAVAVAGPVESDVVSLTNLDWTFSVDDLMKMSGSEQFRVFNDFTAVALALPALDADQCEPICGGERRPDEVLAVLGPGTGMGVSGLVPCGHAWAPLASSEGGHATLAPATNEESQLFDLLRPTLKNHISVEKLLSGPGLVQLYAGLAELRKTTIETIEAETITARARDGDDPLAADALQMFFALLGSFAGNVALTIGARGGVYLAGGILPTLIPELKQSAFRERFVAKGRMREYLQDVPVYVITDPYPGLTGLGAWVDEHGDESLSP
jgi:glucokinase